MNQTKTPVNHDHKTMDEAINCFRCCEIRIAFKGSPVPGYLDRIESLKTLVLWQQTMLNRAKIKIEMARKMLRMEGWDDSWIEDLERGPPK